MQELNDTIQLEQIDSLLSGPIELNAEQVDRITKCRAYLDTKAESGEVFYGINTGFGSLCECEPQRSQCAQPRRHLRKY